MKLKSRRAKATGEAKAKQKPYPSPETSLQAIVDRNGLEGRKLTAAEFDDEFGHLPLELKD